MSALCTTRTSSILFHCRRRKGETTDAPRKDVVMSSLSGLSNICISKKCCRLETCIHHKSVPCLNVRLKYNDKHLTMQTICKISPVGFGRLNNGLSKLHSTIFTVSTMTLLSVLPGIVIFGYL